MITLQALLVTVASAPHDAGVFAIIDGKPIPIATAEVRDGSLVCTVDPIPGTVAPSSELLAELAEAKRNYEQACATIAAMHAAAVGEVRGASAGVVEDVAALKAERDALAKTLEELTAPEPEQTGNTPTDGEDLEFDANGSAPDATEEKPAQ